MPEYQMAPALIAGAVMLSASSSTWGAQLNALLAA
jgi:hypothetical protein